MSELQSIEDPEPPLGSHQITYINHNLSSAQASYAVVGSPKEAHPETAPDPVYNATVEELVGHVKRLTALRDGEVDKFQFHRQRTIIAAKIGKFVFGEQALCDTKNGEAAKFYQEIKDSDIVNVDFHPDEDSDEDLDDLTGYYSVDYSDKKGYELKKSTYEVVVSPIEEVEFPESKAVIGNKNVTYLEYISVVDKPAAVALLGIIRKVRDQHYQTLDV